MKEHIWTKEEDKITFFAYKFLNKQKQDEIANKLSKENGISIGSFKMRMLNFMFLDTGKGKSNYSKQSKEIYIQYKDKNRNEFGLK